MELNEEGETRLLITLAESRRNLVPFTSSFRAPHFARGLSYSLPPRLPFPSSRKPTLHLRLELLEVGLELLHVGLLRGPADAEALLLVGLGDLVRVGGQWLAGYQ